MHRFLILSLLFAGAALTAPLAMKADDHHDNNRHDKRYYDRDERDYHTWNDQEDRAFRIYLGEKHRDYREFSKIKGSEQREYFKWRHDHPDHLLFKVEIR